MIEIFGVIMSGIGCLARAVVSKNGTVELPHLVKKEGNTYLDLGILFNIAIGGTAYLVLGGSPEMAFLIGYAAPDFVENLAETVLNKVKA